MAPFIPMVDAISKTPKSFMLYLDPYHHHHHHYQERNGLLIKSRPPYYPPFPCRCRCHRRSLHGADSEGHGLLPRAPYHLCPEQPHQQGRVHGWEVLPGHWGQRGVLLSPGWEDTVTIIMSNPLRVKEKSPHHWWGKWGSERWNNLPKVTELIRSRAGP